MKSSFFILAMCGLLSSAALGDEAACGSTNTEAVRIASVNERLELVLADSRIVLLAGIESPRAGPQAEKARDSLSAWLAGREVLLRKMAAQPDRWNRIVGLVFAGTSQNADAGSPLDVSLAVLDAGLARMKPSPESRGCRSEMLKAEASARAAGLGLWGDPVYSVVVATDRQAFSGKAGTVMIVEGVVRRIGESRFRTYLNFGPRRNQDFAINVVKRNQKAFEKAGLPLKSLLGKKLRVRGLIETRFGPQIEISHPDEIEVLDQVITVQPPASPAGEK